MRRLVEDFVFVDKHLVHVRVEPDESARGVAGPETIRVGLPVVEAVEGVLCGSAPGLLSREGGGGLTCMTTIRSSLAAFSRTDQYASTANWYVVSKLLLPTRTVSHSLPFLFLSA